MHRWRGLLLFALLAWACGSNAAHAPGSHRQTCGSPLSWRSSPCVSLFRAASPHFHLPSSHPAGVWVIIELAVQFGHYRHACYGGEGEHSGHSGRAGGPSGRRARPCCSDGCCRRPVVGQTGPCKAQRFLASCPRACGAAHPASDALPLHPLRRRLPHPDQHAGHHRGRHPHW